MGSKRVIVREILIKRNKDRDTWAMYSVYRVMLGSGKGHSDIHLLLGKAFLLWAEESLFLHGTESWGVVCSVVILPFFFSFLGSISVNLKHSPLEICYPTFV